MFHYYFPLIEFLYLNKHELALLSHVVTWIFFCIDLMQSGNYHRAHVRIYLKWPGLAPLPSFYLPQKWVLNEWYIDLKIWGLQISDTSGLFDGQNSCYKVTSRLSRKGVLSSKQKSFTGWGSSYLGYFSLRGYFFRWDI